MKCTHTRTKTRTRDVTHPFHIADFLLQLEAVLVVASGIARIHQHLFLADPRLNFVEFFVELEDVFRLLQTLASLRRSLDQLVPLLDEVVHSLLDLNAVLVTSVDQLFAFLQVQVTS